MLNHTKGNLIDMAEQGLFDVIVHGCNCLNTMGSGIAKEIRERYPFVFDADYYHPMQDNNGDISKLGNYSYARVGPSYNEVLFTVINAYTQLHYLPRGIDHFEYESFMLILRKLAAIYPDKRFGFPYIGMGLAGGDKDRIIAMIEDFAVQVSAKGGSVTLVEFA